MPEHFAAEVKKMGLDVSMAELQGHLLRHKGEPLEVFHCLVVGSLKYCDNLSEFS